MVYSVGQIMVDLKFRVLDFSKTFDTMEQALSISGRTGTLGKFDGEDANVPFFEKVFLGGPYNLRGWGLSRCWSQ